LSLNIPALIKEVGRGPHGSRDLSGADAEVLFAAMLDAQVPDMELGALLIAYRMKGESSAELQGFMRALDTRTLKLEAPAGPMPVVLPSYNGARKLPNLTPLLALLLAREGIPVLLHGPAEAHGRITSAAIFAALGMSSPGSCQAIEKALAETRCVYAPLAVLAPSLERLLATRARIGVRSSSHTLAKLLCPFSGMALRVVPVTHPDYQKRMREFLPASGMPALLMRGSEGEPVAGPRRALTMEYFAGSEHRSLSSKDYSSEAALPESLEVATTARWIERALAGAVDIPATLRQQCRWISQAARGELRDGEIADCAVSAAPVNAGAAAQVSAGSWRSE